MRLGNRCIHLFDWGIQSDDAHKEAALAYQREQSAPMSKSPYLVGEPWGKHCWVDHRDPDLGGVGDDSNDGLTIETPLRTIAEATWRIDEGDRGES